MAIRTVKSATPMCVVTIDFNEYLLPLNKGLALVALMQNAKTCDARYDGVSLKKTVWTEAQPPRIGLEAVTANQVKPKPADSDEFDGDEQVGATHKSSCALTGEAETCPCQNATGANGV